MAMSPSREPRAEEKEGIRRAVESATVMVDFVEFLRLPEDRLEMTLCRGCPLLKLDFYLAKGEADRAL
jgi:hypothetical protein